MRISYSTLTPDRDMTGRITCMLSSPSLHPSEAGQHRYNVTWSCRPPTTSTLRVPLSLPVSSDVFDG